MMYFHKHVLSLLSFTYYQLELYFNLIDIVCSFVGVNLFMFVLCMAMGFRFCLTYKMFNIQDRQNVYSSSVSRTDVFLGKIP